MNTNCRTIEIQKLKEIQLEILLAVHNFCVENNIKYSLACGTLIGALRHKGYIPWDDDIDICLLRTEYKKLEKSFPSILNGKYRFLTLDRNDEWFMPWGKIVDTRTIMTEESRYKDKNLGVFIDVFPMDDVPDDDVIFMRWNCVRKFFLQRWFLKNTKMTNNMSFKRKINILLTRFVFLPVSMRKLAKIIDAIIQNPNYKDSTRIYESCDSLRARHNQSKKDFEDYIDLDFEGFKFKAMVGYDDYLHNIYGDYMKLPPNGKRVTHHSFNAYWK